MKRLIRLGLAIVLLSSPGSVSSIRGAIYRWDTGEKISDKSPEPFGDYRHDNLSYADLANAFLFSADLCGANLTRVIFRFATLTNADLSGANLIGTRFPAVDLTGAILTGTNGRSAKYLYESRISQAADTRNFVRPDGTVQGVDVRSGETWRLWDWNFYSVDGTYMSPRGFVRISDSMAIDPETTLRPVFEDDVWGSTLAFDVHTNGGIDVALAGTLQLDFAQGVDVESLVGTTFELFDWLNANRNGTTFDAIVSSQGAWDVTNLYTTGEVTLIAVVPEPSSLAMALAGLVGAALMLLRRK